MSKRFNYFEDDDIFAVPSPSASSDKGKLYQIYSFLRYVIVVAVVSCLRFLKALFSKDGLEKIKSDASSRMSKQQSPVRAGIRIFVIFLVIIALVVSSFFINIRLEAKREERFNKEAYKICSEYSEKYGASNYKSLVEEYDIQGYMMTGLCYVRELDFNSDSTSELLLIYNDDDIFYAEIWGFDGDEFKKLYNDKISYSHNFNDDVWFGLYSDSQKNYIAEHDDKDISKVNILKLKGDAFKQKSAATYNITEQAYSMNGEDCTNSFERIKVSLLKQYSASMMTEETLDRIDSFGAKLEKNEKKKEVKSNALKGAKAEYWSIIEQYNKQYGIAMCISDGTDAHIEGLAYVDLIDFDGKGEKELVVIYRKSVLVRDEDYNGNMVTYEQPEYYCEIYTYAKNMLKRVYQSEGLSNKLNSQTTKYFMTKKSGKQNILYVNRFSVTEYGRCINASSKSMKLDGDEFVVDKKAEYQTRYGYTEYYIDGRYKYKSSFESEGGYDAPFFDGSETDYDQSVWSVAYLQVPGTERGVLDEQVSKTQDNIRKINPDYTPVRTK